MARQKEKKKRKEHTKDASIVFAEIETKLPADLVIHRSENYTNVVVHNTYWSTEYPTYIKKEKRIVNSKQSQQYAIAHWLGNLFGATDCYEKSTDDLINQSRRVFNDKEGEKLFRSMYEIEESRHTRTHHSEQDEFSLHVILSGAAVVETTEPQKQEQLKQEIYYDAIGLSKNFTKYAGVTPTVYFKYVNYCMRDAFRQPEDEEFVLKNCLDHNGGCRLNKSKERNYYNNRNFFLKLWNSKYKTLIPFFIKSGFKNNTKRRKWLVILIKGGFHLNAISRNKLFSESSINLMDYKTTEDLMHINTWPSGLLPKLGYNKSAVNVKMFLNEKKKKKLRFDQLDVYGVMEKYNKAIAETYETLLSSDIEEWADGEIGYKRPINKLERDLNSGSLSWIEPIFVCKNWVDYMCVSNDIDIYIFKEVLDNTYYYIEVGNGQWYTYSNKIYVRFKFED